MRHMLVQWGPNTLKGEIFGYLPQFIPLIGHNQGKTGQSKYKKMLKWPQDLTQNLVPKIQQDLPHFICYFRPNTFH